MITIRRRQNKGAPFKFLVPLVYAPVLPLIRLSLRHRPVLRDRLFTAVLVGAFAHGFYLVYPSATTLYNSAICFTFLSLFWKFTFTHGEWRINLEEDPI
ncbi:hypothetical protein M9H77_24538 [Catharanthus roseus]|uniref:Uncharacterized protein n=1 Tax=Catharanthus roseus TaxID=4058 RepID=A0ACC0AWH4_CATRO|nr:hypothetical protein M9H77_24538 [Catharanthus roseus]